MYRVGGRKELESIPFFERFPNVMLSHRRPAGITDGLSDPSEERVRAPPRRNFRRVVARVALTLSSVYYLRRLVLIVMGNVENGPKDWDPSWILIRGQKPIAIVMLVDRGTKVAPLREASIVDKISYAKRHGYTLIVCPHRLDDTRPVTWSKLRLVYMALDHYPIILWLDTDTLIWNPGLTVEEVVKEHDKDLVAQLDLHKSRESRYFNAGVFLIRNTPWTKRVLERAYRQWQVVLFQGIYYFDADQDGLNLITNAGAAAEEHDPKIYLYDYGGLWGLPRQEEANRPWVLHFPNCWDCADTFLEYHKRIMSSKI